MTRLIFTVLLSIMVMGYMKPAKASSDSDTALDPDLAPFYQRVEQNGDLDSYFARGVALYRRGRFDLAVEDFENAIKMAQDKEAKGVLNYWLGCTYFAQKAYPRAASYYELASELDSSNWLYYKVLSDSYYQQDRWDDAISTLQIAKQKDLAPKNLDDVLREMKDREYSPTLPEELLQQ